MLDLSRTTDSFLHPIERVVEATLARVPGLRADGVMVVGAWCRDIMHTALDHDFTTAATSDLDLALALSSWDPYQADRWPGDLDLLMRAFVLRGGPRWPGGVGRRRGLVDALTRGLQGEPGPELTGGGRHST